MNIFIFSKYVAVYRRPGETQRSVIRKMEKGIELTDGTVTLRRYRAEDAEPVYRAVQESIREISPWVPWCHEGYSFDDSKTWSAIRDDAWAKGKEYTFVIISNDDCLPLGVFPTEKKRRKLHRTNCLGSGKITIWSKTLMNTSGD